MQRCHTACRDPREAWNKKTKWPPLIPLLQMLTLFHATEIFSQTKRQS